MIIDPELEAVWMLCGGADLYRRIATLAEDWRIGGVPPRPWEDLNDVLTCEYNPLTGVRTPLPEPLQPPKLRPAVPGLIHLRTGPVQSSLRRGWEPGE